MHLYVCTIAYCDKTLSASFSVIVLWNGHIPFFSSPSLMHFIVIENRHYTRTNYKVGLVERFWYGTSLSHFKPEQTFVQTDFEYTKHFFFEIDLKFFAWKINKINKPASLLYQREKTAWTKLWNEKQNMNGRAEKPIECSLAVRWNAQIKHGNGFLDKYNIYAHAECKLIVITFTLMANGVEPIFMLRSTW